YLYYVSLAVLTLHSFPTRRSSDLIVDKVKERFDSLEGKKIAVLGLAFKPNTDDLREAPSISVTARLGEEGAEVHTYDPAAMDNAKNILSDQVNYAEGIKAAVTGADIAIILTEWQEIKAFPLDDYKNFMNEPVIFDGRNCFTLKEAENSGVEYHSIGRPSVRK